MTVEEIRIALGLQPFDKYAAHNVLQHLARARRDAGLTAYLARRICPGVRCRKCVARTSGRRPTTRAHAHGCPERGKGHAGKKLRDNAQNIYRREYANKHLGQTTRMLCEALAYRLTGQPVIVVGHNQQDAERLARLFRQMADACSVDVGPWWSRQNSRNVHFMSMSSYTNERRDNHGAKVFVDHYAMDQWVWHS